MAMDPGDSGCTHGLSKRIHDNLLGGATGAVEGAALKAFSFAIATAVVDEIQANATAVVSSSALSADVTSISVGKTPNPNNPNTPIVPNGGLIATLIPVVPTTLPIQ